MIECSVGTAGRGEKKNNECALRGASTVALIFLEGWRHK